MPRYLNQCLFIDNFCLNCVIYCIFYILWRILNKRAADFFRSTAYLEFSTPAEARTLDTLIKSQVLYQLSYGCIFFFAGAKVHTFSETTKLFMEILSKKLCIRLFHLIGACYGSPQGSHNVVASCADRCFGSKKDGR